MNKLLVIAGPTASGKSALASALGREFDGVVINADSMQVYRGVPILTAQPKEAEQAALPHALYGVIPPDEPCSAGRWREMAEEACESAWAQGKQPILAGGTGLYIGSLLKGLSPIPDIPEDIRIKARSLFVELGNAEFHAELARRDPASAARLDPANSQRLMRAWEVLEATGRGFADWQAEPRQGAIQAESMVLLVTPPRDRLYQACDARLATMLQLGALDEVRALTALDLAADLPVLKALGVAEFASHLKGEIDLPTALSRAQQATRNYAKRQMTWFRHQLIPQMAITEKFSESLFERIFSFIRHTLLTSAP